MKYLPSFIGNSTDLICQLEKTHLDGLDNVILFSADVESLYPSIDIKDGLKALRLALIEYNKDISTDSDNEFDITEIDFIVDLTTWVLNNNYFQFGLNTIWKQIKGTAMGTPVAVTFACIYLGILEKEAFSKMRTYPFVIYKRYIDDQVGIAKTQALAEEFTDIFSNLRESIKITSEISTIQINFLDLTLYKGQRYLFDHILDIKVFQKPTNKYVYLPHTSYHSENVFKYITAELRRYKLICNNNSDYMNIKSAFFNRLKDRGYSEIFLDIMMNSDVNFQRNRLLATYLKKQEFKKTKITAAKSIPVLFKTTHNPRYQQIDIKKCLEVPEFLYQDSNSNFVFGRIQKNPLLCIRCSPNIRNKLVRSKHKFHISEERLINSNTVPHK
jgi:hypothetical protein